MHLFWADIYLLTL